MVFQVSEGCSPSAHIYIKMSRGSQEKRDEEGVGRKMITSNSEGSPHWLFGRLGVPEPWKQWRCENHINVKFTFPLEFKTNHPELH